jgi:hypothetical protein
MLRKIVDFLEFQKINFENKKVLIAVVVESILWYWCMWPKNWNGISLLHT